MAHVVQIGLIFGEPRKYTEESSRAEFSFLHENANHFQPDTNLLLNLPFQKLCRGSRGEGERQHQGQNKASMSRVDVSIKTIYHNICIMAEMEVICESGFRR